MVPMVPSESAYPPALRAARAPDSLSTGLYPFRQTVAGQCRALQSAAVSTDGYSLARDAGQVLGELMQRDPVLRRAEGWARPAQPSAVRRAPIGEWIRADVPFLAIAAALLMPLIWTAASQIRDRWWPVNDDALMGLSARDVLTGHPPVMGPRSSSSLKTGIEAHHPGPIEAYLLSLPAALFDFRPAGLVLACALWSGITCIAILWVARRLGGTPYVICAALAVAAVWWALGVQISVRPFNPYFGVLPVLLLALLAWGLLRGDLLLMPWFAVTGSVMIQSHLSYAVFVPVVALPVVVVGLVRWYRARSVIWPFRGWTGRKVRWWRRGGWWTVVALLVMWLPPAIELLTFHPNNLVQVARFAVADSRGSSFGLPHAAEVTLRMLLPAPGGYQSQGLSGGLGALTVTGFDARVVFGAAIIALLVGAGWFFPRTVMAPGGRTLQIGARLALVWLAAAVLVVASVPVGQGVEGWNYLQLWPSVVTAWLVTALVLGAVLRNATVWLPDRALPPARRFLKIVTVQSARWRVVAAVTAGVAVVVTPLTSPVAPPRTHGTQYAAVVDRLRSDLASAGASKQVAFHTGPSLGAAFEVVPALGYGLALQGDHVYLPALWLGAEDTDFRKLLNVPATAAVVYVQQLPPGRRTAPTATVRGDLVGVIEGTSGEYFAIYVTV